MHKKTLFSIFFIFFLFIVLVSDGYAQADAFGLKQRRLSYSMQFFFTKLGTLSMNFADTSYTYNRYPGKGFIALDPLFSFYSQNVDDGLLSMSSFQFSHVKEQKESTVRRFEIMFFISLPFTFIISYTGVSLYYVLNGVSADATKFRAPHWAMLGSSSILMSTIIAFHGVAIQCGLNTKAFENKVQRSETKKNNFLSQIAFVKKI